MNKSLLALLCCLLCSCLEEESAEAVVSKEYGREAVRIDYTDIYLDTVFYRNGWVDTLGILENGNYIDFSPVETIWNCNGMSIARQGDTVLLKSFTYTPPDSEWHIEFTCLDSVYDRFLIQADGSTRHLGDSLEHDPDVRLSGDTVSFKQTIVYLNRGQRTPYGEPDLIRWPSYGHQNPVDSLFKEIQKLEPGGPSHAAGPMYRIVSHTWFYVAKD